MGAQAVNARAPRKIGFAATNGQGQRRPRHESQSALSGETGIFRDARKWWYSLRIAAEQACRRRFKSGETALA